MNEHFPDLQSTAKASVDANLALTTAQLAAMEKFANLNAEAMKTAVKDSIDYTRRLCEVAAEWNVSFSKAAGKAAAETDIPRSRKAA